MENTWLEAARYYSSLSKPAQQEYWEKLAPQQQAELSRALSQLMTAVSIEERRTSEGSGQRASGLGLKGVIVSGCLGVVLGIVLTLAAELVAMLAGIQAVSQFVGGLRTSSESGESSRVDDQLDCNSPRNDEERQKCQAEFMQESQDDLRRREELRKQESP